MYDEYGTHRVLRYATEREVGGLPVYERRDGTAITYNAEARYIGMIKKNAWGEDVFVEIRSSRPEYMLDHNEEWNGGTIGDYLKHNHRYVMLERDEQGSVYTLIGRG